MHEVREMGLRWGIEVEGLPGLGIGRPGATSLEGFPTAGSH